MKPFSNGSEYRAWRSRNCDVCKKDFDWENDPDRGENRNCFAETEISKAYVSTGKINEPTAKFIGINEGQDCPHREEK